MSVDASSIGERLRSLVPSSSAAVPLLDQMTDGMPDAEYAAIAVAVIRIRAREANGGPPG